MPAQKPVTKSTRSMKTIDKALWLLGFFTPEVPEFRLTDLARAAAMDKVTTMRIMASLVRGGLIEQHPETRKYRLGAAFLRFARVRESSFPLVSLLQPILDDLAQATGETTHACLPSGISLTTIAIGEPLRAARVFLDPVQTLPINATASGLAYLAYCDPGRATEILERLNPTHFTARTEADPGRLRDTLLRIRETGCAIAEGTFEDEVTGVAAPVFDWRGEVFATVAAACVASRLTPELRSEVAAHVKQAAERATEALGGTRSCHHKIASSVDRERTGRSEMTEISGALSVVSEPVKAGELVQKGESERPVLKERPRS